MTTRARDHADFATAPISRQYTGILADLFPLLSAEAERMSGAWAWRVLRSGAVVSMRITEHGRRRLRIARREKPKTEKGEVMWNAELRTFLKHFDCQHWRRCQKALHLLEGVHLFGSELDVFALLAGSAR